MENSGHAFAFRHFTPASFSQFLGEREPFCGSFFNLHKQCVGLLFAVTDKHCSIEIVLRKKSYRNKVTEKLLEQTRFNESPTQIPTGAILQVAVFVMVDVLLCSAWAFKTNLKCFGLVCCYVWFLFVKLLLSVIRKQVLLLTLLQLRL